MATVGREYKPELFQLDLPQNVIDGVYGFFINRLGENVGIPGKSATCTFLKEGACAITYDYPWKLVKMFSVSFPKAGEIRLDFFELKGISVGANVSDAGIVWAVVEIEEAIREHYEKYIKEYKEM